jgi:hypothetical protein
MLLLVRRRPRTVGPLEHRQAIVDATLGPGADGGVTGRGMEFPDQSAAITRLGKQARKGYLIARDELAIGPAAGGSGIAAGQQTGTGRRADRAGAAGVGQVDATRSQGIQGGRAYPGVAVAAEGIPTLLVGENRQNIGALLHVVLALSPCCGAPPVTIGR